MKCKNCGANYKTWELKCPYCGTENVIGKIWLIERTTVRQEYEDVREGVKRSSKRYVFDKILNRILLISIGLFLGCVVLAIAAPGGYNLYRSIYRSVHTEEMEQVMEEYYLAGEYCKLYDYMSQYDLFGQNYFTYAQAALMSFSYNQYKTEALCFLSQSEEEKEKYDYYLRYAIMYSHDVWQMDSGIYSELDPKNVELHEAYKNDILAFWTGMLGLTEEEIRFLTEKEGYLFVQDLDELSAAIIERRAWA